MLIDWKHHRPPPKQALELYAGFLACNDLRYSHNDNNENNNNQNTNNKTHGQLLFR